MENNNLWELLDKYFWLARIFPAILSLIPLFIFQYVYFDNLLYQGLLQLETSPTWLKLIVNTLFLYVASQVIRFFGKDIFERIIFRNGMSFPTTQLLLFSDNNLTSDTKMEIRLRIESTFKTKFLNQKEEEKDEERARKRIKEIISRVRKRVGYNNKILNNYNIEYGFIRNILGGMILFIVSCGLNLVMSYSINTYFFNLNCILLIFPFLLILFSNSLLRSYGNKYAKELFDEFMVITND